MDTSTDVEQSVIGGENYEIDEVVQSLKLRVESVSGERELDSLQGCTWSPTG